MDGQGDMTDNRVRLKQEVLIRENSKSGEG
jgi:hypothetical protein